MLSRLQQNDRFNAIADNLLPSVLVVRGVLKTFDFTIVQYLASAKRSIRERHSIDCLKMDRYNRICCSLQITLNERLNNN